MKRNFIDLSTRYCLYILLGTWVAVSTTGCTQSQGTAIGIEGKAQYVNGFTSNKTDFAYEAVIAAEGWKIKIFPNGQENTRGHVEYGFSGTNQFFLEFVNSEPYPIVKTNPASIFLNGSVTANGIPTSPVSFVQVYWLAYRLACFPPMEELPEVLPGSMFSGPNFTNLFQVEYETSTEGTIDEIRLINPGLIYGSSGRTYPHSPPYDKGYVIARFSVMERKRIDGISLPVKSEWSVLAPAENGQTRDDLRTIHHLTLSAELIGPIVGAFMASPEAPDNQRMVVKDYRLATMVNDPDVLYFSTNGFWYPEDENFKARAGEILALANESGSNLIKPAAVTVFLLLSALTAFLLLRRLKGSDGAR